MRAFLAFERKKNALDALVIKAKHGRAGKYLLVHG